MTNHQKVKTVEVEIIDADGNVVQPEKKSRRWIRIPSIVYLMIGLAVYLIFYAPEPFSWANPWLYVVTVLWPLALAWKFLVWFAIAAAVVVVLGGLFMLFAHIHEEWTWKVRQRRRTQQHRQQKR